MGKFSDYLRRVLFGDAGTSSAQTTTQSAESVDPRLIAVLVAAATVALSRPVTLRRVTFINRNTISGWAEAGRTAIQLSHNLRRTV